LASSWAELAGSGADITTTLAPYIGQARDWALNLGSLIGSGIVEIFLSLLIAFFFYRDGNRVVENLSAVLERIAGPWALRLLNTASGTLKGVVHGVLGTNAIQAILAGIGFRLASVPGALFLAFLCFFLTLVPGGAIILWLPAVIWLFKIGETGWAIFLIVWNLLVFGVLESILRTFLIGRGSPLPTLLVLFGLLGGLMAFGFIGLFLGPCLLALGFTLIQAWSGIHREAP
jgi:predicted PurR-regulated permease PerM